MKIRVVKIEDYKLDVPIRKITFSDDEPLKSKISKRVFFFDSSPEVFNLSEGDEIFGVIVTKRVKPYSFSGVVRNVYTAPVLGKFLTTEELDIESEKVFRKLGVKLLDDSSLPY